MERRAFFAAVGAGLLAAPVAADAQQTAIRRVGVYSDTARTGPLAPKWVEAFRGGLRELGWVESQNVVIDFRESRTIEERPATVASLLRTKPEVIVASVIGAFVIRPSASQPPPGWTPVRDIPIVFVGQSDPVGVGLVESLARPGGSLTGLSYLGVELNSKRLQMLSIVGDDHIDIESDELRDDPARLRGAEDLARKDTGRGLRPRDVVSTRLCF